MKRFLDIALSALMIIILSPLLLLIYIMIETTSRGPALFKQVRMGKDNKEFNIYKFRTMKINAPNLATNDFHDADIYITKVGRFLRKTSLDELPQLFNIFQGTMSFVGPRPVIIEEKEVINLRTDCGVNKIKPGLTGWAQVNGRDSLTNEAKVKLDYEYSKKISFIMDAKIIILTVFKVFRQVDIREPNYYINSGIENDNTSKDEEVRSSAQSIKIK